MADILLHIDGVWRAGASGRSHPILDPATGETIGQVAHAEAADLEEAASAAARGFAVWREVPAFERYKLMRRAAEILRGRAGEISAMMTREQGKPLSQSKGEALAAAEIIDWAAEEGRRVYGRLIPARSGDVSQIVLKEPVGPVAAFTPWNFPLNQPVRKIAAALATGCSVVIKGSEETPGSVAALAEAFIEAGLPAGVLNIVFGTPSEISEFLIAHPAIRKITFTGSTPVGKSLAALAGQHMKRATMELGGHAPVLVFGDADVAGAVTAAGTAKFRNAGQVCTAPTRFLVEKPILSEFTERFAALASGLTVGPGDQDGVKMGPLANPRRLEAMEALVADAVARGARIVTGGKRIGNRGFFFEPTVLADVPRDARIMNEEPFGPVATINGFETADEAITEANRLPYGLAAYVSTRSAATVDRITGAIESGMLSINHHGLALPETPFGGIKDSGYGSEGGSEMLEAYLNTKFVTRRSA